MSLSGIRDISVLREGPEDRRPVRTYVEYDEAIVIEAIVREISRGGQVSYLFNNTQKIAACSARLAEKLPGARIVFAHGKMSERRLESIVEDFSAGEFDVLVCTTIIESGIDMPNVNTIIVEDADRLGLAQLYQIRGRVGRSERQAFAYITYRPEKILTEKAAKRLAAIRDFTELGSGFKIALRDLEVRGAGSLLGGEQHGHLEAVGYDLYCKILEESIREEEGVEPTPDRPRATLEIETDAFIAPRYIPDDGERMDLYRRLASVDSPSEYRDVLDEMIDRYGDPPPEALRLVDIAYCRRWAERNGISKIAQREQDIVFYFSPDQTPNMDVLSRLMAVPEAKGMLLFNAGTKPYIVYRRAASDPRVTTVKLRNLLMASEA